MKYQAVLFAADGSWVVDFPRSTKDEVMDAVANMGSRWFFYPFTGITTYKGALTTSRQRVVEVAPNLPQELEGKSIRSVGKWFAEQGEATLMAIAEC
jgi:hypothetical protein